MASGARLRPRQSRGLSASNQQAVIFIDEVDSILSQRREGEQEGTVRVKNEILVQMDGVSNADASERLLLVGATNRPQELDEAARRRLQPQPCTPRRGLPLTYLARARGASSGRGLAAHVPGAQAARRINVFH